ncbi:MAG: hypothetical protein ACE5H3_04290 [Planctomycetota bacterium]
MTASPETRFPESALRTLEFPEVLEWISRSAQTPPGRRAVVAFGPDVAWTELAGRRQRGQESLAALEQDQAPVLARAGDLEWCAETANKRTLEGRELLQVLAGLECVLELRLWAREHSGRKALCACIADMPDLEDLRRELARVLDARGEIRDEADPLLARTRRQVEELFSQRARGIERIAGEWGRKGILRQRQPILRGGRLLLAVTATRQGRALGVVHDVSGSGDTVFMEPAEILALSNRLEETRRKAARLETQILNALSQGVACVREELVRTAARVGEIDAALAAANWCREVGGCFPVMDSEDGPRRLELHAARHPLLLRAHGREGVVPLALELGGEADLLVVTGPNTGGKTVALKTVGLLACLARCGLPVSAEEGTRFPFLSGIDADIGDPQSIQTSLSTFSGHLERTLRILRSAGSGSLVLLDELGTGTDPEEGAALGQTLLEELLRRGALVVASTHLGVLKLFSLQVKRAENASMEFDAASLQPLFRLLVGVPGASHALEVAERLGLPGPLLQRARELARRGGGAEQLLARVSAVRREAELLRERAREQERTTQRIRERMETEEAASRHIRELREGEAETVFRGLQARIERILEDREAPLLERLRGADREQARALVAEIRAALAASDLGRRWQAFLKGLHKGDVVWVPRFRERLKILRVDRRRECVRVRAGNLDIQLPFREITWVEPPPDPRPGPR